jgi:outer membrane protein OmpA-like peptidoglycan-associated protein
MTQKIVNCIVMCVFLVIFSACQPKSYVVLLENPDGTTGALTVTDRRGTHDLTQKGYGINLDTTHKAEPFEVSDEKIQKDFGKTLAVQPEPPITFTLYFHTGTTALTFESQEKIKEIVSTIRKKQVPRVQVFGHSDRKGDAEKNYRLAYERALAVKQLLIQSGVPSEMIVDVASHGEENPLIPTPDGVSEPKNRRVEVLIL